MMWVDPAGVPELIVTIAPRMEELIKLREDVKRLRFETNPPARSLEELLQGTPITIRQTSSGLWDYTIALRTCNTGGSGLRTYADAFRAAVMRFADTMLVSECSCESEAEE